MKERNIFENKPFRPIKRIYRHRKKLLQKGHAADRPGALPEPDQPGREHDGHDHGRNARRSLDFGLVAREPVLRNL